MNKEGREFLSRVREVIEEAARISDSVQAAHTAAFGVLVLIDGSGESMGTQYRLLTEGGKKVEFQHHELG